MQIEWWPIDRPIPYARNARKISGRAIDKVAASIQEFGWQQPIVVDVEEVIVVGHVRLLAAKKLGLERVPVYVATNLTPAQVKAYRIMDNRSHEETGWDMELLGPEMLELKGLNFALELTGFETQEIRGLMAAAGAGLTDEDACPEVQPVAVTVPGDLWLLGSHRLLCGDSTSVEAVEKLMGGRRPDGDGSTLRRQVRFGLAREVFLRRVFFWNH